MAAVQSFRSKFVSPLPPRVSVLGLLLPQLVKCQALLGHPLLPHTCIRLLGLPPGTASQEECTQVRRMVYDCIPAVGEHGIEGTAAVRAAAQECTQVVLWDASSEGLNPKIAAATI